MASSAEAPTTWDADLRFTASGWSFHDFRGDRWCNISNSDNRVYLRNAYRVLLTRARQGMVIFVPPGNATEPTFGTENSRWPRTNDQASTNPGSEANPFAS